MSGQDGDSPVEPKPFKLADYTDIIEREAVKFDVPAERAIAIAGEVDGERETALQITTTRKESELREVFEEIYDDEVARRQVCPVEDCGQPLKDVKTAIVHMRVHLLFDADNRTRRAVAKDIEAQVFPTVEQEMTAALTAEDRSRILTRLRERRKLLDSGD